MDEPITSDEKEKLKEQYNSVPKEQKKPKAIKWPFKKWGQVKKAEKQFDQINVIYLNQKLGIEILQTKIYGGNFLVIREKVYRFAASKVWRYKNFSFCVAKEWDRELVGREDYEAVVSQGSVRSPLNDPVLIKALIQAKLAEKKQQQMSWLIWVILGVIGIAVAFFIFGGGSKAPAATPITPDVAATTGSTITPSTPAVPAG